MKRLRWKERASVACVKREERKEKIDLPLSAGERGVKENNMVSIDPRFPGIKK
jgi:hypothetical protein